MAKDWSGKGSVVELKAGLERHDVIAMARKFADDLEAGVYGEALNVMLVLQCKQPGEIADIEVFGWGPDASGMHGLGMLHSGAHILQTTENSSV